MPSRLIVAKQLAEIFKVIAHPDRIRVIEELRQGEQGVTELAELLDLPATRVSQHLSLLRAHRLVNERRDGRRHFYQLIQPEIAAWIVEGVDFLEGRATAPHVGASVFDEAKKAWLAGVGNGAVKSSAKETAKEKERA